MPCIDLAPLARLRARGRGNKWVSRLDLKLLNHAVKFHREA